MSTTLPISRRTKLCLVLAAAVCSPAANGQEFRGRPHDSGSGLRRTDPVARRHQALSRFAAGRIDRDALLAVQQIWRPAEWSPELRERTLWLVPSLGPTEFVSGNALLKGLQEDGRLPDCPTRDVVTGDFPQTVQRAWGRVMDSLIDTGTLTDCDCREFQAAVTAWIRAEQLRPLTQTVERVRLRAHLDGLRNLARSLDDPKFCRKLHQQLTGFAGGNLSQLVTFLTENELNLRVGSQAQADLAALLRDVTNPQYSAPPQKVGESSGGEGESRVGALIAGQ